MEAEVAAVLHWLVDQTRPARERVLTVVADDVKTFLDKHYTADVPPITIPTVHESAGEPADPKDAEIERLKAELAAAQVPGQSGGWNTSVPLPHGLSQPAPTGTMAAGSVANADAGRPGPVKFADPQVKG